MPPSSPLNPKAHQSFLGSSPPAFSLHHARTPSRRASGPPKRSSPFSGGGDHPSPTFRLTRPSPRGSSRSAAEGGGSCGMGGGGGGGPPSSPTVSDALWREKFKKRCIERARKDREKEASRRRGGAGADGMDLDAEEDGRDDDEEDGDELEIFRRIVQSQAQKELDRSLRTSSDMESLLEEAEGEGDDPDAGAYTDQAYQEYLESLDASEVDASPPAVPSPPLSAPPCPSCLSHPALAVQADGSLLCGLCGSALSSETARQISLAWQQVDAHEDSGRPHFLLLSLPVPEAGLGLLALCTGCDWDCALDA